MVNDAGLAMAPVALMAPLVVLLEGTNEGKRISKVVAAETHLNHGCMVNGDGLAMALVVVLLKGTNAGKRIIKVAAVETNLNYGGMVNGAGLAMAPVALMLSVFNTIFLMSAGKWHDIDNSKELG